MELHKTTKRQPPASRSVIPCLSPGTKELIPQSSVPLLSGPRLRVSSTWKSVYSQCESDSPVSEWAADRILSWNVTSNLFFLSSPASTIDSCRKCWQTLVLLLTQLPASWDIPTHRSTSHTCVHALASCKPVPISPLQKVQQLSKPGVNRNRFKTLWYHPVVPPTTAQGNAKGRESRGLTPLPSALACSWGAPI